MRTTETQRRVLQKLKKDAKGASLRALSELRDQLKNLEEIDTNMIRLIGDHIPQSEATINFNPDQTVNGKILVDILRKKSYYANIWELPHRDEFDAKSRNQVEMNGLGYPNFPISRPEDRPIYAALNVFRAGAGSAITYGDTAFVLSPAVLNYSTLTCLDTLYFYFPNDKNRMADDFKPAPVGTADYFYHQLLQSLYAEIKREVARGTVRKRQDLYEATLKAGIDSQLPEMLKWAESIEKMEQNLPQVYRDGCNEWRRRILGISLAANGLDPIENREYWELQIHGRLEFNKDVLGLRSNLAFFGTQIGSKLQKWAEKNKWFLTWACPSAGKVLRDPNAGRASCLNIGSTVELVNYKRHLMDIWNKCEGDPIIEEKWLQLWETSPTNVQYEFFPLPPEEHAIMALAAKMELIPDEDS